MANLRNLVEHKTLFEGFECISHSLQEFSEIQFVY